MDTTARGGGNATDNSATESIMICLGPRLRTLFPHTKCGIIARTFKGTCSQSGQSTRSRQRTDHTPFLSSPAEKQHHPHFAGRPLCTHTLVTSSRSAVSNARSASSTAVLMPTCAAQCNTADQPAKCQVDTLCTDSIYGQCTPTPVSPLDSLPVHIAASSMLAQFA